MLWAYESRYEKNASLASGGITLSGWAQTGWPNYGNDGGGTRYSAAQQIIAATSPACNRCGPTARGRWSSRRS